MMERDRFDNWQRQAPDPKQTGADLGMRRAEKFAFRLPEFHFLLPRQ